MFDRISIYESEEVKDKYRKHKKILKALALGGLAAAGGVGVYSKLKRKNSFLKKHGGKLLAGAGVIGAGIAAHKGIKYHINNIDKKIENRINQTKDSIKDVIKKSISDAEDAGNRVTDRASEEARKVISNAKNAGHEVVKHADEATHKAISHAEGIGNRVTDRMSEEARKIISDAKNAGHEVVKHADEATHNAISNAKTAGHEVVKHADEAASKAISDAKAAGHEVVKHADEASHKVISDAKNAGHEVVKHADEATHKNIRTFGRITAGNIGLLHQKVQSSIDKAGKAGSQVVNDLRDVTDGVTRNINDIANRYRGALRPFARTSSIEAKETSDSTSDNPSLAKRIKNNISNLFNV